MTSTFPAAKLSDIAYLNPTLGGRLPEDELVSFVPMASVSAETAKVETTQDRPYSEVSKGFTPFLSGDVLFAKITPCFENGKIAQANLPRQNGFGSTEFHVVRSRPGVSDARYLHHYLRLKDVRTQGQRRMTGSGGQRRVPASFLSELRVPVPSLDEQRRIAAILDQAEALRIQRRAALAQLDSLSRSIFLDMFGDPVANERGWPAASVSDFVAGFESGKSLVADDEDDSAAAFRVLKVSAVTSLEYKPEQSKAVPSDYVPPKSHIVRAGDLLFSRANTTELIGATAFVSTTPDNLLLPDKLWRFVWHQPTRTAPLYIWHLFQQPKFRKEIGQRASGTSGSMKNISQEKVLSIRVGHPPLTVQQTFATRIRAIEALKATHRAALAELDALFASLQQRAFNGELTSSTSRVQLMHTKARDFSELCRLDAEKALEALIYVAKRMPEHHFYKSLKALYFADKHQLEHQGRLIYGETHCALPMGPVPQAAYDAAKVLSGELLVSAFADDALRASLRRTERALIPLRDADPAKLSAEERASLDWAIRYVAPMSFDQVKTASHDSAYERTPRNQPIQLAHIIEMLPEPAKRKFFPAPS